MGKPKWASKLSTLTAISVIAGCTGAASQESPTGLQDSPKQEAITLKAYAYNGALGKEDFEKYIAAPVKSKFPNVTLEYIVPGEGSGPTELLTAGAMPDIIMTGLRALITFQELDVTVDLREFAAKHKLDLTRYRKEAVDAIQGYGSKGELYALPFYENYYMMAYNKDIFDKFSIPYPTDQMTWEQVKALAMKLTRVEDGITYKGIQPIDTVDTFGLAMSLSFIDDKTGKAKVTTDEWKRAFEMASEMNTIPGNEPKDPLNIWKGADDFMKDKNVAMMPWFGSRLQTLVRSNADLNFNWDVVSFPSFSESPGQSAEVDAHVFALSKTSKHQEEAFQVIQYLTSSEELQGNFVKLGRALPSIKNDNMLKQFGSEYPLLQTKNIAGVFKSTPRQPHKAHKFDDIVRSKLRAAFADHLAGKMDINTALRKAEEEANKEIETKQK
ncbi:ABC transporter substrate-binding protein [Paenibacillus sp. UNC451MF]|uniref:ABC transporter substrate-binding protein n=1 Tax=Paenibacillus sp. UNC451MF TaxID=1449063 RepID=UPI00048EF172|nr:extracellular solute-binding protein [Paenibacillus sp. UNC451MF]